LAEEPKDKESASADYLEYRGDSQYGTEFLSSHTITPKQAEAAEWTTKLDKDLVWTRREGGRYKGRMLLALKDIPDGVAEELSTDPAFRVVSLKQ
jgi:hypothetical protein